MYYQLNELGSPREVHDSIVQALDRIIERLTDLRKVVKALEFDPNTDRSQLFAIVETILSQFASTINDTVYLMTGVSMYAQSYLIALQLNEDDSHE